MRIGRFVIDHQHLKGRRVHAAVSDAFGRLGDWQRDRKYGARSIRTICGADRAPHGLHKSARDSEAQTSTGPNLIKLVGAMKLIENKIDSSGGMPAPSSRTLALDLILLLPRLNAHCCFGRRILCGVVEEIEEDLLEQHRIQLKRGQVGRNLNFDIVSRQNLVGTFKRSADDFADILRRRVGFDRAGFEPGHLEQVGNEAVEPLQLLDDRRKQIDFASSSNPRAKPLSVPAAPRMAARGVFKS